MVKNFVFVAVVLFACGQPIKGEQGPPGSAGAPGPTGAPGVMGNTGSRGAPGNDGSSLAVTSKLHCYVYSGGVSFAYYTAKFSNGMRWVTCEIYDAASDYAVSEFFGSSDNGALTGGCVLTYDIDTASGGWWSFQITPQQTQYHDIGSASNGTIVSFGPTGCTNLGQP